MKKHLNHYLLILCIFICIEARPQSKLNIGISAGKIWDRNWNIPFKDFNLLPPNAVNLRTAYAIACGINLEYSLSSKFKLESGITFLQRKIDYKEFNFNTYGESNFSFQTIEIPLSLTYRKHLTNDIALLTLLGVSADYIVTASSKMGGGSSGTFINNMVDTINNGYKWNIINPQNLIPGIIAGVGLENDFNKCGRLQILLSYHYQVKKEIRYKLVNYIKINNPGSAFEETSGAINGSYIMLNLKYFIPLFKNKSK